MWFAFLRAWLSLELSADDLSGPRPAPTFHIGHPSNEYVGIIIKGWTSNIGVSQPFQGACAAIRHILSQIAHEGGSRGNQTRSRALQSDGDRSDHPTIERGAGRFAMSVNNSKPYAYDRVRVSQMKSPASRDWIQG